MIKVLTLEDVIKKGIGNTKNILIVYRWNWRLNRFIRDLSELFKQEISIDGNNLLDTNLITIDIKNLQSNQIKDLQKNLKRYDFKYMIQ